jgi:hypothetical protein
MRAGQRRCPTCGRVVGDALSPSPAPASPAAPGAREIASFPLASDEWWGPLGWVSFAAWGGVLFAFCWLATDSPSQLPVAMGVAAVIWLLPLVISIFRGMFWGAVELRVLEPEAIEVVRVGSSFRIAAGDLLAI